LGGEITFLNIIKFAVGIGVALFGFYIGGWGVDRTVDRGRCLIPASINQDP